MNTLTYTQEQILSDYSECTNLGELFKAVEATLREKGSVVCQFQINGMDLREEDEKRLASAPLAEIANMQVKFQRPETLLLGAIDGWCNDLPFLVQHTDQLAAEFRFGKVEGHLRDFVQLIDECQMLIDSLIAMEALLGTQSVVGREQWLNNQKATAKAIGEALQAMQKKDYTLLADTLDYDIGHSLQMWLELLTEVKNQLASQSKPNTDSNMGGVSSK